ncbi:hypothetical protein CHS0354_038957 [Potamilus streckersoni]|uniref:Peroxisomal ATPase PEX1 n=1 Tax=Potamilus streckersoni TaxID=2493646 RepID=A0AAE0S170_9BIVA|nr:hypothetical protein CHS0354_038957 [Potamilus streckersoni]
MSFKVAAVRYSRNKDCLSVLSTDLFKLGFNEPFLVIKVVCPNKQKAFFSWSGETISSSINVLQINGVYANKLGLRENDEVIIEYVPSVPTCCWVRVEPLSVDDWEILERHALHIEAHLMNQVRVVWTGQVLPVWVDSICIFIKIGTVEPKSDCVVLTNQTEVHVLPKLRNQSSIQQPFQEPFTKATVPSSEEPLSPVTERQRQRLLVNQEIKDLASGNGNSRHNHSNSSGSSFSSAFLSLFGLRSKSLPVEKSPVLKTEVQSVGPLPLSSQKPGLNLCLRVQQMLYDTNHSSSKIPLNSGNSFPDFNPRAFPHQPSTVYVDLTDLEKQWKVNRHDINNIFFAKLTRLRSPKEQEQEKSVATVGKGRASPQKSKIKSRETDGNGLDSPSEGDAKNLTSDKKSEEIVTCVVRVIVIDNRRQFCNEDYQEAVESIFEKQTLCRNSVLIPDLLRRYLKADITSRVWIQTVKPFIVKAVSFNLHVLGNVPKNITTEMIQKAFRHWLAQVADNRHPLVVFQGLFITFPIFPENFIEGQLIFTHNSEQREENIVLLHLSVLNSASIVVNSGSREILHTTIRPMLAYTGVSSFDPYKPTVELSSLGGVSILAEKAISHLEICFASKPLNEKMFLTTPGLINGMLLITGVKGSGKTSLANAVLRQVADKPNYAHTVVVECKPWRGKKVDTIHKMLEFRFNEAAWRQPAVILLDDLDHIMGSPSGPESEMSAEALYAARIAEAMKDLLRKEIRNLSQIAVIVTSQSRSSLHPIIVSSRGTHFVQEVVEITPPNKEQRVQILEAMIKGRGTLMTKIEDSVNYMKIADKTEGYVARDFFNLLNRAVHAHILTMGRSSTIDGIMELTQDDFERAFHGFTPASLRNVPLHEAGELGWDDIGGLKDIKKTLVQTLQWPAKYPMLFANSPLRLQSGLLLYGAPGTGKTLLAGAVAKECGLNFISIKGPELLSKYIGASEQAIRDLFNRSLYFLLDLVHNIAATSSLLACTSVIFFFQIVVKADNAQPILNL